MLRGAGFTIIELLIVVALVAALLSVGAPAMTTMVMNNRISTGSGDLMMDLTFARATAISRTQRVGMCASSDQLTCNGTSFSQGWIIYMDANANGNFDAATEVIVRVHEQLAGALTVTPTPPTLTITFRPTGAVFGTASTFQVCKSGYRGRNVA